MKKLTTLLVSLAMVFGLSTAVQAVVIVATFDNLDEMYLGAVPIEFDTNFDNSADFVITNNTGETWTDFHILESWNLSGVYGTETYSGVGTATWTDANLDIVGLSVNSGDTFEFSLICDRTNCNLAGMTFYGYPTIDVGNGGGGQSVPEPVTLLLLSTGLIGVGFFRRKKI